jgi:hypothetical protein
MTDKVEVNPEITGSMAPGQEEPTTEATPDVAPAESEAPQSPEIPEPPKGVEKFADEYAKTGELSDNSFKELESMGISRDVVENYIKGVQAIAEQSSNVLYNSVGGRETYDAMIEWAGSSLSESEIQAYNNAVSSGDNNQAAFAVKSLEARYRVANNEPRFVEGSAKAGPSGFNSVAELVAAMGDPRYKNDEAYRAEVTKKIANSSVL